MPVSNIDPAIIEIFPISSITPLVFTGADCAIPEENGHERSGP